MRRRVAFLLMLALMGSAFGLLVAPVQAQNWNFGTIANISDTLGVNDGRVCIGEGSRKDIGCPTFAPSVSTGGLFTATSIATGGLTVTGATSLSTVSATVGEFTSLRVNGVNVTGGGGTALGDRISTSNVASGANLAAVVADQGTVSFTLGGTPGAAYLHPTLGLVASGVSTTGRISGSSGYFAGNVGIGTSTPSRNLEIFSSSSSVPGIRLSTSAGASASDVSFDGSTLFITNYSNGPLALSTQSGPTIFSINSAERMRVAANGNVGISTSNPTASLEVNGTVSATSFRTPGAISASVVSVTALQLVSQSTSPVVCNSGNSGTLRYNSPTTTLELCTGTGWQPMGVGIPAGTISAFASTTCPVGWSEYTAARGRFLRGIDNGAGNDPDGTRTPGAAQADALQQMTGSFKVAGMGGGIDTTSGVFTTTINNSSYPTGGASGAGGFGTFDASLVARTANETRPKNVAVTFCQFNGTSNGWNNPLSGGSTSPGGTDTQVQYNSSGSFAGSSALTFSNAASRLTATNISSTAVDVSGRVSASVLQLGRDTGTCSAATAGSIRVNPVTEKLEICRRL